MKLPRDINGDQLAKALSELGYQITRQRGSHIRLTTEIDGTHHEVVPRHRPLKPGTLDGILKSVARHHGMEKKKLLGILKL